MHIILIKYILNIIYITVADLGGCRRCSCTTSVLMIIIHYYYKLHPQLMNDAMCYHKSYNTWLNYRIVAPPKSKIGSRGRYFKWNVSRHIFLLSTNIFGWIPYDIGDVHHFAHSLLKGTKLIKNIQTLLKNYVPYQSPSGLVNKVSAHSDE